MPGSAHMQYGTSSASFGARHTLPPARGRYGATVLLLVVAALAWPSRVTAQTVATGSIGISVQIVEAPQVEASRDLQFGTVVQGSGRVSVPPESAQAGKFILSGNPSLPLSVSYAAPSHLEGPDGETLPLATTLFGHGSDAPQQAAPLASDEAVTLDDGDYYLYVAGDLDVGTTPAPGLYRGNFVLTVAYD